MHIYPKSNRKLLAKLKTVLPKAVGIKVARIESGNGTYLLKVLSVPRCSVVRYSKQYDTNGIYNSFPHKHLTVTMLSVK